MFANAAIDKIIASSPCVGISPIPYLAAGCGLRGSEIFGLELDQIDFVSREIHVRQQLKRMPGVPPYLGELKTKTSRRTVELPEIVQLALARHIEMYSNREVGIEDQTDIRNIQQRPAKLLFLTAHHRPLHRSNWSAVWRTAVRRAGLPPGFGLHGLRRYFATLLIHNGAAVKTVQLALGHSTPMITLNTYAHEWPDALDRRGRSWTQRSDHAPLTAAATAVNDGELYRCCTRGTQRHY